MLSAYIYFSDPRKLQFVPPHKQNFSSTDCTAQRPNLRVVPLTPSL